MKSLFDRPEKFLYRRNPTLTSFIAGTRFGLIGVALAWLACKLV